ncbi:MAG: hypothetical protein NTV93_00600 [Verrucomicrobia bacterium]|nr:hypothetical protein [Verrucomicrobiota bacterium]
MSSSHQSPPFGGWSRRRRDPAALLHGVVSRAVAAFHRMPHMHGAAAAYDAERIAVSRPAPAKTIDPGTRQRQRRRSALSMLRSRRHGKDRILRYIILPAIAILTAVGIFVLLRS